VSGPDGPLPGALADLTGPNTSASIRTDARGDAAFVGRQGVGYTLSVSAAGHRGDTRPVKARFEETVVLRAVQPGPTLVVTFRAVAFPQDKAVLPARMQARFFDDRYSPRPVPVFIRTADLVAVPTGERRASYEDLPAGTWRIVFLPRPASDWLPAELRKSIGGERTVAAEVPIERGGRILVATFGSDGGRVVAHYRVLDSKSGTEIAEGFTPPVADARGGEAIVPAGRYRVVAGEADASSSVDGVGVTSGGTSPVEIRLPGAPPR
jgi:hypothetical protein